MIVDHLSPKLAGIGVIAFNELYAVVALEISDLQIPKSYCGNTITCAV